MRVTRLSEGASRSLTLQCIVQRFIIFYSYYSIEMPGFRYGYLRKAIRYERRSPQFANRKYKKKRVSSVAAAKGTAADYKQVIRRGMGQVDTYAFVREYSYLETGYGYGVDYGGVGAKANNYDAIFFILSEVINPSEFTTLFDYFCIDKVVLKFFPGYNNNDVLSTGINSPTIPLLTYYVDRDDDSVPTAETQFDQIQGIRRVPFNRPVTITLSPKPLKQYFQTDTGQTSVGGTDMKKDQFINIANNDTRHYGIKMMLDNRQSQNIAGSNSFVPTLVTIRYQFRCRGVR